MALALPVEGVRIGRLTESPPHPLDDWVDGIRNVSEEAFRAVHEAVADDLVSFAFGMVNDRRTAEDIVQETFVELVRAAPKLKGDGSSLRAWLYKSVRYGCLDEYRRRSRRPETPSSKLPDRASGEEMKDSLDPRLEAALATLNRRQRTLVILKHVVGLSAEETATVMGMTRRAVYTATDRAEAKLRAGWGKLHE